MTHAALKDLLPCPFCGGVASMYEPTCNRSTPYNPADRAFPIVRCACGAQIGGENWDQSGHSAITTWNRRAALSAMEGEAVAFCDPSNPHNNEAFSWPGVGKNPAHTSPLYTDPPPQQAVDSAALLAGLERESQEAWMLPPNTVVVEWGKVASLATHPTPSPGPQGGGEAAAHVPDTILTPAIKAFNAKRREASEALKGQPAEGKKSAIEAIAIEAAILAALSTTHASGGEHG